LKWRLLDNTTTSSSQECGQLPRGLVVYLDVETYKKLKAMSAREGKTLKDLSYDIIRNAVYESQGPEEIAASLLMQLDDS